MRLVTALVFWLLYSLTAQAQDYSIRGRVTDSITGEPIPFVSVIYGSGKLGTTTNIDGYFSLKSAVRITEIRFSCVGYEARSVKVVGYASGNLGNVQLAPAHQNLSEVVVLPGLNPAHRIINKALENKSENDPEQLGSFSYTAYNKMIFTMDQKTRHVRKDTVKITEKKAALLRNRVAIDTSGQTLMSFFDKQHIMITEAVSQRHFLFPSFNKETVIAARVSGLKQPYFQWLATQFQSFSFYREFIDLGGFAYVGPLSGGCTSKYFYQLEDTLTGENQDTVFVISFRPYRNKQFSGLKGVLHINTNGYAIESVIAEPYDSTGDFFPRVQQKYHLIEGNRWFPEELNTEVIFNTMRFPDMNDSIVLNDTTMLVIKSDMPLTGSGKSYISQVQLNIPLEKKDFEVTEYKVNGDAGNWSEEQWDRYRPIPLNQKEIKTYEVIDSIGDKINLDQKIKIMGVLMSGKIPLGKVDMGLNSLGSFNQYEGFRLSAGLSTNDSLCRYFSLGGVAGYGFRDKAWKWGGNLEIYPVSNKENKIYFRVEEDVVEPGVMSFFDYSSMLSSELFRKVEVTRMNNYRRAEAGVGLRIFHYLTGDFYAAYEELRLNSDFVFFVESFPPELPVFNYSELGFRIRYAFREKRAETWLGSFSLGTDFPVLYLNFSHTVSSPWAYESFWKTSVKVVKSFRVKYLGTSTMMINAGLAEGNMPLSLMFAANGSKGDVPVFAENTFTTIKPFEFYSNRMVALYFRHSFESLLFHIGTWKPEPVLCYNFLYGELKASQATGTDIRIPRHGYHECGILINKLIGNNMSGYGVGVFSRVGPYASVHMKNNLTYMLTLTVKL